MYTNIHYIFQKVVKKRPCFLVHTYRLNEGLCSPPMTFELGGKFIVPNPLYHKPFLLFRMTSEGYWARRPIQNITKPLMMLYYLKIFSVVYTMNIWNLHSKWHISVTANKCLIFFVISKVALGYHIERQLGNMNNFL